MNLDEGWQRPTRFAAAGAILGAPLGWLVAWQLGSDTSTATMLGCWAGALLAAGLSRPESVALWAVTGTAIALVYVIGGIVAWMWLPGEPFGVFWGIGGTVCVLAVVGVLHRHHWRSPWGE